MPQLNNQYTFDEFNLIFPVGELIRHTNGLLVPRYARVWDYSNKVLVRISEPRIEASEKDLEAYTHYTYVMFMHHPELNLYSTLYSGETAEDVIQYTEHHFNPPTPVTIISAVDNALDLIEVNIMSALKETDIETKKAELVNLLNSKKAKSNPVRMKEIQDKIDNLKPIPIEEVLNKSACSYIYYSGDSWHAYYPEPSVLSDFHIRNNKEVVDQKYVDFLLGEEFKELRTRWGKIDTITPGE